MTSARRDKALATHAYVSVIVPVYNDAERLDICLRALQGQSYPHNRFQVLVVDNGSYHSPARTVSKYQNVGLTSCSIPGSYSARNKGVRQAKGDILAFTDADCIPDSKWIECGVRALQSAEHIGLVGGHIQFFFRGRKPGIAEIYDSITYLQQHDALEKCRFAATANMFTWKRVMDHVGPFDTSLKSGGDREWGERTAAAGFGQLFAPDAIVLHPARSSFMEIHKRNLRIHGGHHQLHAQGHRRIQTAKLCREILTDLAPPIRFALRTAKDTRVQGLRTKILVVGLHMLAKYDRAQARIRYQLGLKPTRS